jgi:hypothetical protein
MPIRDLRTSLRASTQRGRERAKFSAQKVTHHGLPDEAGGAMVAPSEATWAPARRIANCTAAGKRQFWASDGQMVDPTNAGDQCRTQN